MSLINREVLYEKACDLEAQALAYVGKIVNDETKIEEWKIWSAILAERTAFKHDIFDAPEVEPEPHWIPVSERLPEPNNVYKDVLVYYLVQNEYGDMMVATFIQFPGGARVWQQMYQYGAIMEDIVAWMPLPGPWRGEEP